MKISLLVVSCLLLTGALLLALPPSWWSDEETRILDESVEDADNFAPANLGQLKHVATQAKSHLDANLLGGSGTAVANVVAGFVTGTTPEQIAQNYAPLNIGQLKAVAKPFYDRLLSAGYDTKANLIARGYSGTWAYDYPWNPSTPVAENYAPTNLGQLKMTFSFDLAGFDSDEDGLPDMWETERLGGLGGGSGDDPDGDGLTNLQEFEGGSDPNDYYSQGATTIAPVLAIVSGSGQIGNTNEFLAEALTVEVRSGSSTGALLGNAPVTYTVASGSGTLSTVFGGTLTSEMLEVRTGTNGLAEAWYKQGSVDHVESTISVQTGTAAPVMFTATTLDLVGHWKLDEGSGSVAEDAAPFEFTGTLVNSPAWTERYTGEDALSFSGSNDYVLVESGSSAMLDFEDGSFSVAAWVRTGTSSGAGRIVSKGDEAADPGYFLGVTEDGHIQTGLGATVTGTAAETILVKTTGTFDDEAWHHVTAVYDRENATARIYVDGTARVLAKEAGTGGTINVSDTALLEYPELENLSGGRDDVALTISSYSGSGGFFQGSADDVRIYRKALSADEVRDLCRDEGVLTALAQTVEIDEDTRGTITLQHQGGGTTVPVYEIVEEPVDGMAELTDNIVSYYPNAHFSGTDSFRFKVMKGGREAEENIQVVVAPVNDPPLVSVGGGQSITMSGTTATLCLNATVTDIDTDPEDIQLTWIKVSGTGAVAFSGSNPLASTATFDSAGEYVLRLIAYDGDSTRTDSLVVVVNGSGTSALPVVSLEEPSDNQAYGPNEPIGLKADASADAGLTISKVEFYEGSRKIGEAATPSSTNGWFELDWTPQRLGVYQISAKAMDSAGNAAFSEAIQVRVTEGGWFTDDVLPGNDGFAGSGGNGGIVAGAPTGSGGYGPGTGANGGGSSAGGGSSNGGTPENEEEIDSDGDGLPDHEDAVPFMKIMTVPAAPEARYAVIDLGVDKILQGINDAGQALMVKSRSGGQQPYYDGWFWEDGSAEELDSANGFYGPLQDGAVIIGKEWLTASGQNGYTVTEATDVWKDGQLSGGLPPVWESSEGDPPPDGELPEEPCSAKLTDLYDLANAYVHSMIYEERWSHLDSINDSRVYSYSSFWDIYEYVYENQLSAFVSGWPGNIFSSGWFVDIEYDVDDNPVHEGEGKIASDVRVSNDGKAVASIVEFTMSSNGYEPQPSKVLVMAGAGEQEIPGASQVIDLNEEKTNEGPYFLCKAGNQAILSCYNGGAFFTINLPQMPPDIEHTRNKPFVPGRSISNSLVIPMGSSIWRNSKLRNVTDLVSKESEWSAFDMRIVSPNNNILGGYAEKDGAKHAVMLVPLEIKYVDRDNPTKTWSDAKNLGDGRPLYAGQRNGDMVSFKLAGTDSWISMIWTWTAEGPGGETIAGPTGVGMNEWKIADGDADIEHDWIDWKPGKWKIKVQIGSITKEFEQIVGARTTDVVVVGWINPAGVPLNAAGMPDDMTRYYPSSGVINSMTQKLLTVAHLGLISGGSTIRPGPAVAMNATEREYIVNWMFKFAANSAPPNWFSDEEALENFKNEKTNYKLYNRFQIKYLLSENGAKFKEKPKILKESTAVGTTLDPIFHLHRPGTLGRDEGKKQIKEDKIFHQTNDGSPEDPAVSAFNTLLNPVKWNHIGSTISLGIKFGLRYEVLEQVYPTYYIYERIEDGSFYLYQVIPQAANPKNNFNSNPYDPPLLGPAPFILSP